MEMFKIIFAKNVITHAMNAKGVILKINVFHAIKILFYFKELVLINVLHNILLIYIQYAKHAIFHVIHAVIIKQINVYHVLEFIF